MATFAAMRRFGLALPGVTEHLHMREQPSLRAGGKMFAVWWKPEKTTILKLDRDHQRMLFDVRPDIFTACRVGMGTWSYVDIAKLSDEELKNLLIEAWSQVVPQKTRESYSSNAERTKPSGSRQNSRHKR